MDLDRGTIAIYSDIACPWAGAAVHRLRAVRTRVGLDGAVVLDHRPFPLELVNQRATPKAELDAEIPVVGGRLVPDAGWRVWQARASEWPVTTLPALEAVQAAKEQGLPVAEALDAALRDALFAQSRCVSMRHVILEVARRCLEVDADKLADALDDGRHRRAVIDAADAAQRAGVKGSPHLFLPDGSDAHNPGVRMHWVGEHGQGFPVVDAYDPGVYEDLLRRAAG